jgi:CheY-like chemotaxis protein
MDTNNRRPVLTLGIDVKKAPKAKPPIAKNVLVVEDDLDTANSIAVELVLAGYGVRKTVSRDEALAVLDLYLYDFILMDYHMQGMTPGDFVDKVRRKRPNSKIILMTAGGTISGHAAELGIHCCLPKPLDPLQVVSSLMEFAAYP